MGLISFLHSAMKNFNYKDDYRLACEDIEYWQKALDRNHDLPIPNVEILIRRIMKDNEWKKKSIIYLSACLCFTSFDELAFKAVKKYDLKVKAKKEFENIFELDDCYLRRNAKRLYDSY